MALRKRNYLSRSAFWLLACSCWALQAQEFTAPAQPEPVLIYNVRERALLAPARTTFCIVATQVVYGLHYKVLASEQAQMPYYMPVNISPRGYSNTYPHNMPGAVEFYWIDDSQSQPVPAFKVNLSSSRQKTCIALRVKPPEQAGQRPKIETVDIDVSPRAFPAGSYMVLNLADRPLAGTIDNELFRPLPVYVKPKRKARAHEIIKVDIYAYIEEHEQIDNVIRSQINLMGNRRYWICFFPGPDPKRARVTNVVFPEQMSVDVELMNKLNVQAQKDFED